MKVILDVETISTVDLLKRDTVNYAKSPDTHISVMSFKVAGEKKTHSLFLPRVCLIDTQSKKYQEAKEKAELIFAQQTSVTIIAHNYFFERMLLQEKLEAFLSVWGIKLNPELEIKYVCTQQWSQAHRKKGSLEMAAEGFDLDARKYSTGAALMKKVCKGTEIEPNKKRTVTLKTPTEWVNIDGIWYRGGKDIYNIMIKYCEIDVEVTDDLYKKLKSKEIYGDLKEYAHYTKEGMKLTNHINETGIRIDLDLLDKLEMASDFILSEATSIVRKHFGADTPNQNTLILRNLRKKGLLIDGMNKDDIQKAINNPLNEKHKDLFPHLKEFSRLNKACFYKIAAAKTKNYDGRLNNFLVFGGAAETGRWSGRGVQPQNFPRSEVEYETVKEFMKEDYKSKEKVLANLPTVTSALRPMLIPDSDESTFFIGDLSQIEARLALHVCGYDAVLEKLYNGWDIYVDAAMSRYKRKLTKKDKMERNFGKILILAGQFGQGAGALMQQCEEWGIPITFKEALKSVAAYRRKYKKIKQSWGKYDTLIEKHYKSKKPLKIKLRSGRVFNYGTIGRKLMKKKGRKDKEVFTYDVGGTKRQIYGSLMFQQTIQADARDIMNAKAVEMAKKGYDVRLLVHDEIIVHVPKDSDLDKITKDWETSAEEFLSEKYPNLKIESECIFSPTYYGH